MLTLKVTAVHGVTPTTAISATFSEQGGSIGRNPGVTLMLLDEARTISRQQAMIRHIGSQFFYEEQGSNPSLINGMPVGAGKSVPLKHGDILRIAFYTLSVEIPVTPRMPAPSEMSTMHPFASAPITPPPVSSPASLGPDPVFSILSPTPIASTAASPPTPSVDDPLGLFGVSPLSPAGSSASPDPYLAAFGAPAAVAMAPTSTPVPSTEFDPVASALFALAGAPAETSKAAPATLMSEPMAFVPPPTNSFIDPVVNQGIPDDFDPFSSVAFGSQSVPVQPGSLQDMSFGAPSHDESSIDSLFALGGSHGPGGGAVPGNPLDAFHGPASVDSLTDEANSSNDPLALFGEPSNKAGRGPAQSDHTPDIHSVFTPPKMVTSLAVPTNHQEVPAQIPVPVVPVPVPSPPVVPATSSAQQQAVAMHSSEQDLLLALCEGLGTQLHLPDGLTEEFMYRMGALVRESVQGTIDLLGARAVSKREVKAQATTIMERYNNPLKFAPDVASALPFLLSGKLNPAFLPPISAMRDAHNDLKSHQFGVMAGMRAALEGVLGRFTPEQLENRISKKGVLNSVLPATRKAKLWDSYIEMYKEIAKEASDDFQKLFGEAFRQAYEEQVRLLQDADPEEG
jgi:FHA domain-containing protein